MAYEQRDMSGALFKNRKKVAGDKQPDYKGDCMINSVKLQIAAWIRDCKGGKMMSLQFQDARPQAPEGMGEYQGGYQGEPEPRQQTPRQVNPPSLSRRPVAAPQPVQPPEEDLPF